MAPTPEEIGAPRWRGQRDRLEVWYATFTDLADGTGYWLHHETVAPTEGEPYSHGWAAAFAPDGVPVWERFGPVPAKTPEQDGWFVAGDVVVDRSQMRGSAGPLSWDLRYGDDARPLFTFPVWSWEREVLPASQVVPFPTATVHGDFAGKSLGGARGNLARIYSHGNAERWAWLHADLGGGDVLELVAGAPRRRGRIALPVIPLFQLRIAGEDWPRQQLALSRRMRSKVELPEFSVRVTAGRRRLRVTGLVPPERSVAIGYVDPDGATATCTNSERGSAEIVLERWTGSWETERSWTLDGTAHAEVGLRP